MKKSAHLDLSYPAILSVIEAHMAQGRTESHAFLEWFLANHYRLEEMDAEDCVCDGPDDKGVDGIYVDDNLGRVDVFQSKIVQNNRRTLGDTLLKEFIGTLAQFKDPSTIQKLQQTTSNKELAALLQERDIANKVQHGYQVRGVFLTNSRRDQNAVHFLSSQPSLVLHDATELALNFVPIERIGPIAHSLVFDVFGYDCPEYKIGKDIKVVVAPLAASDLVKMQGITNHELFAWNVRHSLGRTAVNKDITESIQDVAEHKFFLLFHNGLTVLCGAAKLSKGKLAISDYSVVNGCQSLTSLYEQKSHVSSDLRLLTRIIQIPPDSELALKITTRSNNQNGIKARDLQSNNPIQSRLQSEFDSKYPKQIFYRVKRGEIPTCVEVIDNELAGRVLLAFDLREPWTCHQTYKIFDELHARIFGRPEVVAERIVATQDLYRVVCAKMEKLSNKLLAKYTLTRFLIAYLIREALETDALGRAFCANPSKFIAEKNGRKRLRFCAAKIIDDIVIELNAEVQEREQADGIFDFKRELKSPKAVRALSARVIAAYARLVVRAESHLFKQSGINHEN